MKKLLTLVALAAMTLSASAQGIEIQKTTDGTTTTVASYTNTSTDTYKAILKKTPASPATTITLNRTCVGMRTGYKYTLTATVSDGSDVSWSTSNSSVASISSTSGNPIIVTAAGSGNATITATANGVPATCTINVDYVTFGTGASAFRAAVCNVGANYDVEYGDYFGWGETTAYNDIADAYPITASEDWTINSTNSGYTDIVGKRKTAYSWTTYKWGTGSSSDNQLKYKSSSNPTLEAADDAATANWGSPWKMPTQAQLTTLITNKKWVSDYDGTGVPGLVCFVGTETSSLANAHVFLPAAGYRYISRLYDAGYFGYYWSSSLSADFPSYAWYLNFYSGYQYMLNLNRYYDQSVRPVRVSE